MRIRRSVTHFFSAMMIPAIFAAAVVYFGYYTIWGARGLMAQTDIHARLDVRQEQLAMLKSERMRLQHRIELLKPGSVDSDMVEEVARSQLLEGAPDQVAVPRHTR